MHSYYGKILSEVASATVIAISITWHDFTPLQYLYVVATGVKASLIICLVYNKKIRILQQYLPMGCIGVKSSHELL